MLRQPEPSVAQPFGVLREVEAVAERLGRVSALEDWSEIEH
jgi:hypothetical protein